MAVTKILARKGRLDRAIAYVKNGDKTEEQLLTATLNCEPGRECRQMMETKRRLGKTDGVQYYHMIQSFHPGEITPELAMEIAKAFASEHLAGYEAVIGVHTDRQHVHAHIVFNSVHADTGKKYHSNAQTYYKQIRAISDRLCREHGLSVVMQGENAQSLRYIEWLRQSRGQPTFRAMLEADLRRAIEDANDLGHFFLLMEHMGYEIRHGSRLGFRLRGQERFMIPGRRNPLFTEDGIQNAIQGNLEQIEAGQKTVFPYRKTYRPYQKHGKYSGILALYVHYLYVLGKICKQEYPPRMTAQTRQAVMQFERYKEQFAFLRENHLASGAAVEACRSQLGQVLGDLMKRRTMLHVHKKKRRDLYDALEDETALLSAYALYREGCSGVEAEAKKYLDAVKVLDTCGVPREQIFSEKAALYAQLAAVNREIRQVRKQVEICNEILRTLPIMEQEIQKIEGKGAMKHEHRRRRSGRPDGTHDAVRE